jgi:hypothetical protein
MKIDHGTCFLCSLGKSRSAVGRTTSSSGVRSGLVREEADADEHAEEQVGNVLASIELGAIPSAWASSLSVAPEGPFASAICTAR